MADHDTQGEGLRIRPSSIKDLAAVDALLSRSYPKLLKADYPPSVLVTALPLISRAQPELLRSGRYYVAEIGDHIAGAGGWSPDQKIATRAHIRHVGTDDRYLRRGIARALVQHSLRVAQENGFTEMECWSTRTAVPLYASLGFKTVGPIDVPLRAGITFPSIRMMRSI